MRIKSKIVEHIFNKLRGQKHAGEQLKFFDIHTASVHIQTGGTTHVNSTSLFSLDTETEFMTKLWINQESVLKMIGMSKKAVSGILLCVHKLLENNL